MRTGLWIVRPAQMDNREPAVFQLVQDVILVLTLGAGNDGGAVEGMPRMPDLTRKLALEHLSSFDVVDIPPVTDNIWIQVGAGQGRQLIAAHPLSGHQGSLGELGAPGGRR